MKKYLITQQQLDTLASLPMPRALAEELDELKPIEPLLEAAPDLLAFAQRVCHGECDSMRTMYQQGVAAIKKATEEEQ